MPSPNITIPLIGLQNWVANQVKEDPILEKQILEKIKLPFKEMSESPIGLAIQELKRKGKDARGSQLFKQFILKTILSKQGPPGPAPREGLQWKPQTHRWIRPKEQSSQPEAEGGRRDAESLAMASGVVLVGTEVAHPEGSGWTFRRTLEGSKRQAREVPIRSRHTEAGGDRKILSKPLSNEEVMKLANDHVDVMLASEQENQEFYGLKVPQYSKNARLYALNLRDSIYEKLFRWDSARTKLEDIGYEYSDTELLRFNNTLHRATQIRATEIFEDLFGSTTRPELSSEKAKALKKYGLEVEKKSSEREKEELKEQEQEVLDYDAEREKYPVAQSLMESGDDHSRRGGRQTWDDNLRIFGLDTTGIRVSKPPKNRSPAIQARMWREAEEAYELVMEQHYKPALQAWAEARRIDPGIRQSRTERGFYESKEKRDNAKFTRESRADPDDPTRTKFFEHVAKRQHKEALDYNVRQVNYGNSEPWGFDETWDAVYDYVSDAIDDGRYKKKFATLGIIYNDFRVDKDLPGFIARGVSTYFGRKPSFFADESTEHTSSKDVNKHQDEASKRGFKYNPSK